MRRLGELLLVLITIAVGGWALTADSRLPHLVFQISPFADGSHCYFVEMDGSKVETHGGNIRSLPAQQVDEVMLALEAGDAWAAENADYARSGNALLYTQIVLQQGSRVRRVSWKGFGPKEFRLVYRLLGSPIEAEMREAISSAAGSLRAITPSPPEPGRRRAGCGRQEILLERAKADRIVPMLELRYPELEFILHPTMNGFYAMGSRKNVLALKNDVPGLDQLTFLNQDFRWW